MFGTVQISWQLGSWLFGIAFHVCGVKQLPSNCAAPPSGVGDPPLSATGNGLMKNINGIFVVLKLVSMRAVVVW